MTCCAHAFNRPHLKEELEKDLESIPKTKVVRMPERGGTSVATTRPLKDGAAAVWDELLCPPFSLLTRVGCPALSRLPHDKTYVSVLFIHYIYIYIYIYIYTTIYHYIYIYIYIYIHWSSFFLVPLPFFFGKNEMLTLSTLIWDGVLWIWKV